MSMIFFVAMLTLLGTVHVVTQWKCSQIMTCDLSQPSFPYVGESYMYSLGNQSWGYQRLAPCTLAPGMLLQKTKHRQPINSRNSFAVSPHPTPPSPDRRFAETILVWAPVAAVSLTSPTNSALCPSVYIVSTYVISVSRLISKPATAPICAAQHTQRKPFDVWPTASAGPLES
jgi:hypothetical protein